MYHKYSAPLVFDGYKLQENIVAITDDKGRIEDVVSTEEAGDNILFSEGVLSPGFINCHCHLELSHMRGLIPEQTGLIDFVFKVVTQRHFKEDEIKQAIDDAEKEMLKNGIVAVGDICNTSHTAEQKAKRNLLYYNFVEVSGWLPEVAQTRMNNALLVSESLQFAADNQRSTVLTPHAPYSVSEKLWLLLQPYFQNKTISIHNQETRFEDELFIQGDGDFMRMYSLMKMDSSFFSPSGKSSLQTYFSKLKEAKNVVLVHNTFTKEADIFYVKKQSELCNQNVFFCLCANANLYIEKAVPPVDMLLQNECDIVLGTDSLASNWSLNLLDEMKTLRKSFPQLSTEQLLQFATSNGAKALNMNDVLGSFEKGKQPGVLLLRE